MALSIASSAASLRLAASWLAPLSISADTMVVSALMDVPPWREGVIAAWSRARRARPVKAVNALRQMLAALRYRARPAPPATALLILCSEHDRLVNFECSMTIASRWKCSLALHPSAGHDILLDDPDWVIERVQRWLAERAKRAREISQN